MTAGRRDGILLEIPTRPVLRTVPPPRSAASWEQIAEHYGELAAAYEQHVPQIYEELDAMRAAINLLPEMIGRAVRDAVREAICEEREKLRAELRREVQESVPAAEEIASEAVEQSMATVRETVRAELNADDAAELKSLRDRETKRRDTIIAGVVIALIVAAVTFTVGRLTAPPSPQWQPVPAHSQVEGEKGK